MKTLSLYTFILFFSIFNTGFITLHESDEIVGVWEESDNVRRIEIYKNGNEYAGKIVSNSHEDKDSLAPGTVIMDGFVYDEQSKTWEGVVIIPEKDMKFKAVIEMEDKNHIKSTAKIAVFSKSKRWHRVN